MNNTVEINIKPNSKIRHVYQVNYRNFIFILTIVMSQVFWLDKGNL